MTNVTQRKFVEFLTVAAEIPVRPTGQTYRLEGANSTLMALKHGPVWGAKILLID